MNILYVEPYYSGSHKSWIDQYSNVSSHSIKILSLPGNKWKWRIHGGAITLAEKLNSKNFCLDLIICSDFVNLPVFKSLLNEKYKNLPIVMYFHENQITYPWSPHDKDKELKRDLHYHFINYSSSLVSDFNYFNSNYHFISYINGLKKYLKKMPDFNNFNTIDSITRKSKVLNIGCDLDKFNKYKCNRDNSIPIILWNHRWEFDKNPDDFFNILFEIKKDEIEFKLVVLGEKFENYPLIFDKAKDKLKDNILAFDYVDSFSTYAKWLWKCDILPVTSNQDFFGISIIEASFCNTIPILPNRLSYPEIFDKKSNSNIFYENNELLKNKLKRYLINHNYKKNYINKNLMKFDWNNIKNFYDSEFEKITINSKKK